VTPGHALTRTHSLPALSFIASLAGPIEQVQRDVDLREQALDFIALVRAGIVLQPF
jgi:hypothetical protein